MHVSSALQWHVAKFPDNLQVEVILKHGVQTNCSQAWPDERGIKAILPKVLKILIGNPVCECIGKGIVHFTDAVFRISDAAGGITETYRIGTMRKVLQQKDPVADLFAGHASWFPIDGKRGVSGNNSLMMLIPTMEWLMLYSLDCCHTLWGGKSPVMMMKSMSFK